MQQSKYSDTDVEETTIKSMCIHVPVNIMNKVNQLSIWWKILIRECILAKFKKVETLM